MEEGAVRGRLDLEREQGVQVGNSKQSNSDGCRGRQAARGRSQSSAGGLEIVRFLSCY